MRQVGLEFICLYVSTVCLLEFCRLQYRRNLHNSIRHTVYYNRSIVEEQTAVTLKLVFLCIVDSSEQTIRNVVGQVDVQLEGDHEKASKRSY